MDLTRSYSIRSTHGPHGPSFALAVAATGAMLAAAFLAGTSVSHRWWDRDVTKPQEERVTYVAPPVPVRPATPAVPRTPVAPTAPGRADARPAAPTAAPAGGTQVVAPTVTAPQVAPFPAPAAPGDTGVAGRRGAGQAGAAAAAPARGPTASPSPLRIGAELPAPPPLSRAQKDSLLRTLANSMATAMAAAAADARDAKARSDDAQRRQEARTAGGPPGLRFTLLSIPFGGKSPAERKRDSIVDADTRARLAHAGEQRARQRADSVRRDSVRALLDSAHFRRPDD
ncbi:hypothetical protein J421_1575 [Gemmatirosa kalamazoonensis]|uniref:Uncharacterized protein n=1 Tax=Gemmatirosa kalamazoonensis TaxID=861299 RepID=W0RF92_9BACT|nr:hypothetical protein [Gemmatirosa kalamazoonensis]AHG89112.1 hypothetical protein J421_1575 [Gemmatirosa kalamazoonensis]